MNSRELRQSFDAHRPVAEKFALRLIEQFEAIVAADNLRLAVPLQSRIKSFESMSDRLIRKPIKLKSVLELPDFVGVRAILLFRRDAEALGSAIVRSFDVVEAEDTSSRLKDSEFGYLSRHYIVRLPGQWLAVPSLTGFSQFLAEIQVRTVAQHIWAAASHTLQYKQEQSVPPLLRRAIYRVSALLESVDLEFERLLDERVKYVQAAPTTSSDQPLDVDILAKLLDQLLPTPNRIDDDNYAELLNDLMRAGINTTADLRRLASAKLSTALALEERVVRAMKLAEPETNGGLTATVGRETYASNTERSSRGVFYSHVGLVRAMLKGKRRRRKR